MHNGMSSEFSYLCGRIVISGLENHCNYSQSFINFDCDIITKFWEVYTKMQWSFCIEECRYMIVAMTNVFIFQIISSLLETLGYAWPGFD